MPQVEIPAWKCCRCGHIWVGRDWATRNDCGKPLVCPKCRSPYWDTERIRNRTIPRQVRLLTFECKQCGHKWVARIPLPGVCAKCHSPYWNTPKRDNSTILKGRPKGSKTQKVNAYKGRTKRVRQRYGEDVYIEWGKLGGNPALLTKEGDTQVVIECIHYWILDNRSLGKCKKCGAEKQFTPYAPGVLDRTI